MGVMACNRRGCTNVMCDRLILDGSAYICGDCYLELLESRETWPDEMTGADVRRKVEDFMDTEPRSNKLLRGCGIDDELRRLTGGY